MNNRNPSGMSLDFSNTNLPSWMQQGTNDDSWMPMPMPMPIQTPGAMMGFDQFDPAYFAWPDPSSNPQIPVTTDVSMDSMNWNNMDWGSLRGSGQGW